MTLSTIEKILFLKSVPLFERIPSEELTGVTEIVQQIQFEPGETFTQGAVRELWEETGVDASFARLIPVLETRRAGSQSFIYVAQGDLAFPRRLRSVPFEGYVKWMRPHELLASPTRFRGRNREAFRRLGLA